MSSDILFYASSFGFLAVFFAVAARGFFSFGSFIAALAFFVSSFVFLTAVFVFGFFVPFAAIFCARIASISAIVDFELMITGMTIGLRCVL